MPSDRSKERDLLRRALGPQKQCMAVEQLEACLQNGAAAPEQLQHLESCAYCRGELELLRSFYEPPRDDAEAEAVRQITERLASPRVAAPTRKNWWQSLFGAGWFRPAAVLAAAALILVGVGLELRRTVAPALSGPSGSEGGVMRSGNLNVISPVGDVTNVPARVEWAAVGGTSRYTVRLLEVDHTELWSSSTAASDLALPAAVQGKMQPAKTMLVQVTAFDSAGRQLAESEFIRFRVLQKVYTR